VWRLSSKMESGSTPDFRRRRSWNKAKQILLHWRRDFDRSAWQRRTNTASRGTFCSWIDSQGDEGRSGPDLLNQFHWKDQRLRTEFVKIDEGHWTDLSDCCAELWHLG
jgi:hypothetical protein